MILYHGTAAALLPAIMKRGLMPKAGKGADTWAMEHNPWLAIGLLAEETAERLKSVFLTDDMATALWYARMTAEANKSEPVILSVDVPANSVTRDEQGGPFAARHVGKIPAAHIKPIAPDLWADVMVPPLPRSEIMAHV